MMKALAISALALAFSTSAAGQSGSIAPQSQTVVTPIAPPTTMVTKVAPGAFVVTPVPGVAAATTVKVQRFADYDVNGDGVYNPMEFSQALYFLATSDPVAGNPKLPAWDRYTHRGTVSKMAPSDAVVLLNVTADEFAAVDLNNDWRISPSELTAVALM